MSLMCTELILSKILVSRKRCIKTACSQNKIPCTPIQQYSQPTPFKISRNLLLAYTFTQFIMTHLKCKCGVQCERLGEDFQRARQGIYRIRHARTPSSHIT